MSYSIDKKLYTEILQLLEEQHQKERVGKEEDMNFLIDDSWMGDTAVTENVVNNKGLWYIYLVFSHYKNPLLLIRRAISVCFAHQTALVHAAYMRRLAAKDPRGTLKMSLKDYICHPN